MSASTIAMSMADSAQSPAPEPTISWRRGFWSLFVTQFQGAFSDNVYKFLVTFLIIGAYGLTTDQRDRLAPVVGALFALPFILFSMAGGYLADRYSKRSVAIGVKMAEILIMTFGLLGFWFNSVPLLILGVFLMSCHSAFFGPTKYGLLPELLPDQRLSWGNGVLSLGTFVAIISGTVLAGVLSDAFKRDQRLSGAILIGLAAFGLVTACGISRVPPANTLKSFRINFVPEILLQVREIRRDRVLFLAVLGCNYFWFLGALLQLAILFFGKDVLRLDDKHSGYLQASLAIGIGAGSLLAGYLSGRKIEYGLIPLGSLGLAVFGALLGRPGIGFGTVALNLALLGLFGGFYIVPINALIQQRPDAKSKGSVIATSAMMSFVGVFLASCFYYLFSVTMKLSPPQIFLAGALMTLAGTVFIVRLLPDSLIRLLLWALTHSLYRIRVEGRAHIPERGGALFVANHLSLVDALLVQASTDRPIRFIMFKGIYERPYIKPFARIMGVIPISAQLRPREMIHALRTASDAIRNGEVVCIFAEGQITRIGQMLPFRRGFERIMKDVDAPIVPVCLDGVWGSLFSYQQGRFLWKLPRRIPHPVTVGYGKPMPSTATHFEVRQAVQDLSADAWRDRKPRMETLDRAFIRTARRHPFRFAMADARVPRLRFGAALMRTIFLARRLKAVWRGQGMVGILLPPSVPGALVNFAALLSGRVPVNLNYTASDEIIAACAKQCALETVVTSKAFLDKVKLKVPGKIVLLEEMAREPRWSERLVALAMTGLLPARWLVKGLGQPRRGSLDAVATVIFSSGSTGDPKGVVLTHYNIGSNIEQMEQTFAMAKRDRMLGILPFFHSFGFTGTLCLPGVLGVGVAFHPTPLEAAAIGNLVREYAVTFLLATPTFLQLYLRSCEPEDFGSLQFVVTGAEKLPERLAIAFEDKFGIRPLEGYGCTECSPVVAVNARDFRMAGFRQVGAKRGKIGHPLPGISVRIVDPDTREAVPVGRPGLMLVKGPNVMQGYLGRPDRTAEALRDGWYVTGDIAALDEDGFLQITDRLSRFSKIGGEMVPHIRVEEKLHELAGVNEQTFVVTGVPDEKKGERLVVLHTLAGDRLSRLLEKLPQMDLPNLWIPRANQFYALDTLPLLGSGKLDLRKIRELALARSA
jgi:acyl-[acyl-carrier-protein]-phospholipid O-acyltransferase/long-chain-fatty-acid--[acyl-carrier-protein] ligase